MTKETPKASRRKSQTKSLTKPERTEPATQRAKELDEIERDALADRKLSPGQLDKIDQALKRLRGRHERLGPRLVPDESGKSTIIPDFGSETSYMFRKCDAFGTTSWDFANHSVHWLAVAARQRGMDRTAQRELNAALAVVDGVRPENEIEAMLAMQMYAAHEAAMEMMVQAKQASTIEAAQNWSSMATKMMRTFVAQTEALAKLRRGGEQKVRVEHVHVHAGGQAIVGHVTTQRRGEGELENRNQPHEANAGALIFAPGTPLWSEDPERHGMPKGGSEREGQM